MKILTVVHLYPPRHRKGVENYTFTLVSALVEMGHQVTVLTTEDVPSLPDYTLRRREEKGYLVLEMINNKAYSAFARTYDDPRAHEVFRSVVEEVRPDVVHFQHLLFFSLGLVPLARELGLPTAYTLHEFWLQCLRFGLRLLPDGSLCTRVTPEDCALCLERTRLHHGKGARAAMKALQLVRRATTLDLHPLARRARIGIQRLLGGASGEKPAPGGKGSDRPDPRAIEAVRKRNRHVLECLSAMDLFIAPSRFLCDEMVAFGVDASRVVVSDYGFPACGARARSRPLTGGRLRLAFLGNLQPHKGLHVLVEAFRLQPSDSLSLEVWGSPEHAPAYVRELRRRDPRVVFRGEFGPQERGRVLDEIDILVFPSIWYENSPLTIHEAFQAGIPVVASDLGGMAELVIPLRNGLTFRAGDATDLARQLGRLESEPGLVSRLSRGALETRVKTVEEDARELVSRFSSLVARRRKEGET